MAFASTPQFSSAIPRGAAPRVLVPNSIAAGAHPAMYAMHKFGSGAGSGAAKAPQPSIPVATRAESTSESRTERALVLVVEDNRGDVLLVKEALAEYHVDAEVLVTLDGEQAINFLKKLKADPQARVPRVVLLDLNLPKRNGHEVLSFLRSSSNFAALHVIVFSSSNAETDREAALREGANEYICKPSSLTAFLEIGRIIGDALGQGASNLAGPQDTP